jgi:putative nucleotidyltransferase with HDIG domain
MTAYVSTVDQVLAQPAAKPRGERTRPASDLELLAKLHGWFAIDFHLVDGVTGEVIRLAPEQRGVDFTILAEICRAVHQRGQPEILDDEEPLLVLAIPIDAPADHGRVAVGVFLATIPLTAPLLLRTAERLGRGPEEAASWISRQTPWTPTALLAMSQLALERMATERRVSALEAEVRDVSLQLSTTYEEISLLYRLTQNLKLTGNDEELAARALEWLADVVPAEALAIRLTRPSRTGGMHAVASADGAWLTHGPCPLAAADFARLLEQFALVPGQQPLIVNPPVTLAADWKYPGLRELVVVSLSEGENGFGWLAAFNHNGGGQFGSVEASLLSSVAAILGIHSGNAELYQQQREFFAGVVRALTSAIDAKDPYTCGHSDRVARVAVRLAEELGCDRKQVETIYLSGLLHDVGKIGIDDQVLRKPGKLTDAEFAHIKTHTEIGYRILVDIKQLDDVLPVVLHHHEQWDGRGYPHGLAAETIPLLARIVAVADSFDAMSSDRPYRRGMADDKLDAIMREGAGKQWDAAVVDAFFRARDDIRRIAHEPVSRVTLEVRA